MTQSIDRRPSSRVAHALVLASAVLLAPSVFSSGASAQMLGYASTQPNAFQPTAFPADEVIAPDGSATPERLRRAVVAFGTSEAPGTIVIDTGQYRALLRARAGSGDQVRRRRRPRRLYPVRRADRQPQGRWPDWHPPAERIARQPYLPRFMAGGPGNALGARAMYLGNSQYRIHGTNDPSTIGKFVSSGCIRLTNEDVADLFSRVNIGTKVVVLPKNAPVVARGSDTRTTRTTISARPAAAPPRPALTTLPSGRQAMSLSASQFN
jgi:lipoprotein-anchoring transpeptidase ErfK/SrfK